MWCCIRKYSAHNFVNATINYKIFLMGTYSLSLLKESAKQVSMRNFRV